jgi:3-hydroxy acid dehydrogenase / malonic semialdehyde reductase
MNNTVFITGATSGIGQACAFKFAAAGYSLVITGRRQERLDALQQELKTLHGTECHCLCFDVQDRQAVFAAVETLPAAFQTIDILINNAGLALGREFFDEADIGDWDTMIGTNVNGLLYVSRAVLPFMIARQQGHIINIGSVAGKDVYEKGNVYCGTKFAVDAISRSQRIDLLRHRIKVTAIHPGAVETEFSLVRFKGDEEKAGATYKGFTPLTPADVAETVFYCTTLPAHVCINDLVITPTQQANGIYIHKDQ